MSSFAEYFKMSGILNRQGSERSEMRVNGLMYVHFLSLLASATFTFIRRFLKYHV